MTVPYDVFTAAFLAKISEYDFIEMPSEDRQAIVDGFMKRALANSTFKKVCKIDFIGAADEELRSFDVSVEEDTLEEIVEIISEGMLVQWLKPYLYQQELLQNVLNTRDYTLYSPANLLLRIRETFAQAQRDYTQLIREFSYNHGDLTNLHI